MKVPCRWEYITPKELLKLDMDAIVDGDRHLVFLIK